jgi:hypothetical protein
MKEADNPDELEEGATDAKKRKRTTSSSRGRKKAPVPTSTVGWDVEVNAQHDSVSISFLKPQFVSVSIHIEENSDIKVIFESSKKGVSAQQSSRFEALLHSSHDIPSAFTAFSE